MFKCHPLARIHTKGVFIATQLNWTQLTQLNSVQPSQSCFCLWRHDLQTESPVAHAVELSWVELCLYKRAFRDVCVTHPLRRWWHFVQSHAGPSSYAVSVHRRHELGECRKCFQFSMHSFSSHQLHVFIRNSYAIYQMVLFPMTLNEP